MTHSRVTHALIPQFNSGERYAYQDPPTVQVVVNLRHASRIAVVAFSPDGTRALSGSWDLKLWDVATGKPLRTFEPPMRSRAG